ncbi:MAG: penicillin-binding protein 2 [Rhodospirillales bacterium]|nr:penicillin-binding protein 2 [Rhodospirillales bacterium]MCW8862765.1 penicillin-binding protein 2 [Rhodospirillales bacterium]MCW8952558.1 penicillin-binding protein 2 [Rhodospirillales bacterium]MCW8971492.1 penicillin-binding protein 2 [Rhodospirillales bacterium]MCW9002309.1 penicillin-binding protein 2 [Rhodospirillales bacterium]
MHRDSDRFKLFSRRAALLGGGQALLLSGLVARMYYLQVVESDRYKTLADENRINFRLLPPPRGRILDRNGLHLAVNQQNYRVVLIREQTPDIAKTLQALGALIRISKSDQKRILREVKRKRSFVPVTVRENLTWEEVARIEVNTPDLPGVMIDVGQSRNYPDGADMAHVLGYVAAVSEAELTGDPLLELPGFRIGKAGVEKVHDLALRGSGGTSQIEVNALGRVIREISRREGEPGADVHLSIEKDIQKAASIRMGEESASAVVMDIHTGEVLALASTPSFDPNAFDKGLSAEDWRALTNNPRAPFSNKAIAGQYSPGSTFKMVVALAALEKGVISPSQRVFCQGHTELGDAKFHCWKRDGHGLMDMSAAISQSCDVYFYEIARRTGIERIASMARRFGMGETLNLDLPGESKGLVPDPAWKRATVGGPWHPGETLLAGIGQGYILTTPLQLAVMMSRLVNGGRAVFPRLTHSVTGVPEDVPRETPDNLGVNPAYLKIIRDAMAAVVNDPSGTAYRSRIDTPGMTIGGKTGTSQVRRISRAEREVGVVKNEDLPWEQRDHALFVGYGPIESPRYAISVVVEHGGSGSRAAAPVARDILREVIRRDPVSAPPAGAETVTASKAEGQPWE